MNHYALLQRARYCVPLLSTRDYGDYGMKLIVRATVYERRTRRGRSANRFGPAALAANNIAYGAASWSYPYGKWFPRPEPGRVPGRGTCGRDGWARTRNAPRRPTFEILRSCRAKVILCSRRAQPFSVTANAFVTARPSASRRKLEQRSPLWEDILPEYFNVFARRLKSRISKHYLFLTVE